MDQVRLGRPYEQYDKNSLGIRHVQFMVRSIADDFDRIGFKRREHRLR